MKEDEIQNSYMGNNIHENIFGVSERDIINEMIQLHIS